MLEIIKSLLTALLKNFNPSDITKLKRQKQLRELGLDLFRLYFQLNEIYTTAMQIIRRLDICRQGKVEKALRHIPSLGNLLHYQFQNLNVFRHAVDSFAAVLLVIDAEVINRIRPLIYEKANALAELMEWMEGNSLPLFGPTAEELARIQNENYFSLDLRSPIYVPIGDIQDVLRESEIDVSEIEMYFETRKPYEQLEEIREVLVKLRSALAQHFSLEDILIDIGDRTFQEGLGDKTYAWMMGPRKSKDS